jgi:circadian clock protein KaiC
MRGISFRSGYHDFTIKTGGIEIYPRLIAAEHNVPFESHTISSGNPELDALLGGLENGTNMLILGSSGVGKSSIGLAYTLEAARRGQRSAYFAFDEGRNTLLVRARTLGMPLDQALEDGIITHRQIDPAELSPGEFTSIVRKAVEQGKTKFVVIDSLNGFMNSMPDERFLLLQMHELLSYLGQQGVFTIVILAQHGLVGPAQTPIDLSYLSDAVLMLRYFEAGGAVRRALSVVKKRTGAHETTIREFKLDSEGLHVGPPLKEFTGIFAGTPQYTGAPLPEMEPS